MTESYRLYSKKEEDKKKEVLGKGINKDNLKNSGKKEQNEYKSIYNSVCHPFFYFYNNVLKIALSFLEVIIMNIFCESGRL